MIAHALPTAPPVRRSTSSIEADALTRIPSAHFRSKAWAVRAIASCTSVLVPAIERGHTLGLVGWVRDVAHAPDADDLVSVVSAVCRAIVADTFATRGDVRAVTALIADLEEHVRTELATYYARKEEDAMIDPDNAELAASLVRVVQMHDKDTATHLEATAALAKRIAETMGLSAEQVYAIELGALLHDVGKVGVRRDVLRKPEALTAEEWQEMRLHPESGAAVLLDTPKLAFLAPIVRAHHERIDGYGYPDRLRADEIPLEARVIAVADAFHAMTTERPYRQAMMPNDALAILAEHAGTQFDTDVVDATLRLFRYKRREHQAIA